MRRKTLFVAVTACAIMLGSGATRVQANQLCLRVNCLTSHEIDGIALGMTLAQVSRTFPEGLLPLGGGQYESRKGDTSYTFLFTPLGHLYLIDSKQKLGHFTPDLAFGAALTKRLAKKYGPPEASQLPNGIADWSYVEKYDGGNGWILNRFTEQLSASLDGFSQPTTLNLHLADFRILRHDAEVQNAEPQLAASRSVHF